MRNELVLHDKGEKTSFFLPLNLFWLHRYPTQRCGDLVHLLLSFSEHCRKQVDDGTCQTLPVGGWHQSLCPYCEISASSTSCKPMLRCVDQRCKCRAKPHLQILPMLLTHDIVILHVFLWSALWPKLWTRSLPWNQGTSFFSLPGATRFMCAPFFCPLDTCDVMVWVGIGFPFGFLRFLMHRRDSAWRCSISAPIFPSTKPSTERIWHEVKLSSLKVQTTVLRINTFVCESLSMARLISTFCVWNAQIFFKIKQSYCF